MPESMTPLVAVGVIGALFVLLLSLLTNNYSLNNIKSKTVGDGQYGTARWAVCSAANDWRRWWIVTMCIAS